MNKLFFIAFFALCMNAGAQIILEYDYNNASSYTSGSPSVSSQLMIVNFEVSGEHYVKINRWGKTIEIYDMNHALQKTINCSGFPMPSSGMGEILYLSEQLFNTDTDIEFMYGFSGPTSTSTYTGIYKEDGTLIFSDTAAPIIRSNTPLQQYPIYNTSQGTKMILSYHNGHAKVFSLPGVLSNAIQEANGYLMQQGQFSNLYPNPSNGEVTLQYELPKGVNEGELVLYNMQGAEVKRYKVDNTFNDVIIDNSQLPAGTYFYQLQTGKGPVGTKKMVVVK